MKLYIKSILIMMTMCLISCVPKTNELLERKISSINKVDEAISFFGEPDAKVKQADGLWRYSWIIHKERVIPEKVIEEIRIGPGWWGSLIPSPLTARRIPERVERDYCFFVILTDDFDNFQKVSWEGNSCDFLFQRNVVGKQNSLPTKN